jgi:hypothetical protein
LIYAKKTAVKNLTLGTFKNYAKVISAPIFLCIIILKTIQRQYSIQEKRVFSVQMGCLLQITVVGKSIFIQATMLYAV